jgi:3-hydroxy acid dehydrogenase/malonic semialdehyde reductase
MAGAVFITGATSGFGAGCARLFAEDGRPLVLAARRGERLRSMSRELGEKTAVHIIELDVRNRESVEAAIRGLDGPFREVEILINNAGLALGLEPAHDADLDDWETMVDTNIKGLMYCTRFLLPGMVERNRGHIINLGSVAGSWPYPGGNAYGATKAFVEQFSRNLRADLPGTRVRVTNIAPGMAETEFSIVRFKDRAAKAADVYKGTDPLTADDIAGIIHWIAGLPEHVNVNSIEVMPTCQTWGNFAVHRRAE